MIRKGVLAAWAVWSVLLFAAGYAVHYFTQDPEVRIVKQTEIKYEKIPVPYEKLDRGECIEKLKCVYEGKPFLDTKMVDNRMDIRAGICDLAWSRSVYMDCGTSGNWKLRVGLEVAGVVLVLGTVYVLTHR